MKAKFPHTVWIWPRNELHGAIYGGHEEIEKFFNELYSPFRCLYFSRGRVATTAILDAIGAKRNDLVFIQPFSSYCVQSAVSRISTPLTIHPEESKYQIVYHNFGRKEVVDQAIYNNVIIEDSVDSLVICSQKEEIFPNNGNYAIFSLSKLFHLPFGSIVVCRTNEAYEKLKESPIRNTQSGFLDLITNPLFTDEILYRNPLAVSTTFTDSVYDIINTMFDKAKSRINSNVNNLSKIIGRNFEVTNRLPSNIFSREVIPQYLYEKYNIEERNRHIYDYVKQKSISVNMFPVHLDIIIENE